MQETPLPAPILSPPIYRLSLPLGPRCRLPYGPAFWPLCNRPAGRNRPMPYTSRQAGPNLTPEEMDAATALRRYHAKGATQFDWTPTAVLYRAYRDWWAEHRWQSQFDPEAPARLTRRQFGRAVRRVFPSAHRRRRTFHGRQQWGYAGILGPWSTPTQPARGKWLTHAGRMAGVA
jgi:hypothetical protein